MRMINGAIEIFERDGTCSAVEMGADRTRPIRPSPWPSRPWMKSPRTAGICERFHQTIQNEFYASAFRRKLHCSLEELQLDADGWMSRYNSERTHPDKYCYGKTPMQTFIESATLAHDKRLDRMQQPFSDTAEVVACKRPVRQNNF